MEFHRLAASLSILKSTGTRASEGTVCVGTSLLSTATIIREAFIDIYHVGQDVWETHPLRPKRNEYNGMGMVMIESQ
jgi:hypothetical protein